MGDVPGVHGGCIGETCTLALTLGGVYLLARRVITWQAPAAFIGTVFLFTALLGLHPGTRFSPAACSWGAFFMATDYTTTPATGPGKLLFGVGCGLLTVVIRVWGSYPRGGLLLHPVYEHPHPVHRQVDPQQTSGR